MKFPRTSTVKGNTWLRKEAIKRMMSFLHENPGAAFGPLFGKKLRAVKVLSTMTSVLRNLGTKGEASLVRFVLSPGHPLMTSTTQGPDVR